MPPWSTPVVYGWPGVGDVPPGLPHAVRCQLEAGGRCAVISRAPAAPTEHANKKICFMLGISYADTEGVCACTVGE